MRSRIVFGLCNLLAGIMGSMVILRFISDDAKSMAKDKRFAVQLGVVGAAGGLMVAGGGSVGAVASMAGSIVAMEVAAATDDETLDQDGLLGAIAMGGLIFWLSTIFRSIAKRFV